MRRTLFLLLLAACGVAWWLTASAASTSGFPASGVNKSVLANYERPLAIARSMSGLADTPEEQQLAAAAEKLADQAMDLAFEARLDRAARHAPAHASGPLWNRLRRNQAALAREQATVQQLQAALPRATAQRLTRLQTRLQLAQAQLGLDQARLADARQDLLRAHAGLPTAARAIAQEHVAAHAAVEQVAAKWRTHWSQLSAQRNPQAAHGLVAIWHAWRLLVAKDTALSWARAQALAAAARLTQKHNQLHHQLRHQESHGMAMMQGATRMLTRGPVSAAATAQAQAAITLAHTLAAGQQRLRGYDQAIQLETQLAHIYGRWDDISDAQQELALHQGLGVLLYILAGIGLLWISDRLLERAVRRWHRGHGRIRTLHHLLRFGLVLLGLGWILILLFGKPTQILTFLGLAGAGLTVALQDMILSLCGWFVLIGRRGVTLGDWVEINGVNGEVVEITLLRTVIQEAGNWAAAGHPTGRRVYFPNSYVFSGYYFNFSTRGQWLWDEMQISLPPDADAQSTAMALTRMLEEITSTDTQTALREWRQQRHEHPRPGTQKTEAPPPDTTAGVQILPAQGGTTLRLRYVTTASQRFLRREEIYRRAYAILQAPASGASS